MRVDMHLGTLQQVRIRSAGAQSEQRRIVSLRAARAGSRQATDTSRDRWESGMYLRPSSGSRAAQASVSADQSSCQRLNITAGRFAVHTGHGSGIRRGHRRHGRHSRHCQHAAHEQTGDKAWRPGRCTALMLMRRHRGAPAHRQPRVNRRQATRSMRAARIAPRTKRERMPLHPATAPAPKPARAGMVRASRSRAARLPPFTSGKKSASKPSSTACVTFPVMTVFGTPARPTSFACAFCTPIAIAPVRPHSSVAGAAGSPIGAANSPAARNRQRNNACSR